MPEFSLEDVAAIGSAQRSPRKLNDQLWGVLSHSLFARISVESCDRETGDYRVVLQGTLDVEPPDRAATG